MNTMNNVFICKWKKTGSQWHVWVKGKPKLSGQGETLEAAEARLERAIWDSAKELDDVIPTVMEFDPPLPVEERLKKFFTPPIYKVYGGNGRFDLLRWVGPFRDLDVASMEYINSLYEKGVCKTCKHGIGKRTEVELIAEQGDGSNEGLWLFHNLFSFRAYIYSDRFLSLLTSQELERLEFRECRIKRKGKRKYYELKGSSIAHNVGVKGFDAIGGECPDCGHRSFHIDEPDMNDPLQNFICRSDLPNPVPSCFAITINGVVTLCMTQERYNRILGDKNAKGITSELIGVIDDDLCERHPRLHTSFRECETCSKWPKPEKQRCWELPVTGNNLNNHPSVIWLRNEIKKPELITIVRQEDTIEHIMEMVESGTKIKESRIISFRCPDCWRSGRLLISPDEFRIAW